MDIMEKGLKRNLYLRPRKDADLLRLVKEEGLDSSTGGDYSHFIRELVRDGAKFRQLLRSGKIGADALLSAPEEEKELSYEDKYGSIVDEGMMADGRV